jgi:transcriptional regulator with XRE-family HTH domain
MAKTIRSSGHKALCRALIETRKQAGFSQEDLAGRLKCHQSLVARIESGERRIDVVELVVLCRALMTEPKKILMLVESATSLEHEL